MAIGKKLMLIDQFFRVVREFLGYAGGRRNLRPAFTQPTKTAHYAIQRIFMDIAIKSA